MTVEEIEARWKAATPGPWEFIKCPSLPHICSAKEIICENEMGEVGQLSPTWDAIAAAPTDIAYLLDRVRKERDSHNESLAELHDELARHKRAHAWFVEETEHRMRSDEGGTLRCCCGYELPCCDEKSTHEGDCEWLKAKELRI